MKKLYTSAVFAIGLGLLCALLFFPTPVSAYNGRLHVKCNVPAKVCINEIEVGKHGIIMGRGVCQGVLLPQVATEQGWDRQAFIENTCLKAGLPIDAWQDPETTIEIFSAQVFGEKDFKSQ